MLDFGLAKLTQSEEKVSHKTRTGSVMGTPYYMAPEQCEGRPAVDHRADIYSLGVILFEMMTGKVPFGGEGYGEIIVKHITMPPPAPRDINPAITPAQQAVILHALIKPRDGRFSSMEEFRTAMLDPEHFAGSARAGAARHAAAQDGRRQQQPVAADGRPATRVTSSACPCPPPSGTPARSSTRRWKSPARARGWSSGCVAAAAVAAGAAVFLMKQSSGDPRGGRRPDGAAADAPAGDGARALSPQTVKVSFSSEPAGAMVVSRTTGEALGTTPFERELPQGPGRAGLRVQEGQLRGRGELVRPCRRRRGQRDLAPQQGRPGPGERGPGRGRPAPPPAASKSTARRPSRPEAAGPARPLDDDAVLEPSFKF